MATANPDERSRRAPKDSAPVEALFGGRTIAIRGAREHNLKNVDLDHPARQAGRVHRPVGFGQIVARLRHHLCRGAAPLCRVAVGLRPPVPGNDAEARCRPYRRAVAGDRHRAEDHVEEPPLDGRHGDRNPRLYAPLVGAGRHSLFASHRPADREPNGEPDGRPRAGVAGADAALPHGAGRAWAKGRIPQGNRRLHEARLSAAEDRRRVLPTSPTRRRSTRSSSTTSRSWSTA